MGDARRSGPSVAASVAPVLGHITHYDGLDAIREAFGEFLIDWHTPPAGTPTQGVEAGYMANAWIRMKHPNYDQLRQMMDTVGRTVKVHAS